MTAPAPPAPSGPASNATLAEVGLQATYLDRSVDPCVDFVQFACGGWLSAAQIPADQPAWSTASEAAEKNGAALKTLLEQATGKLGDFYASCMDEAAIEKAGLTPLKPLLDKTTKVKDAKSWLAALVELHKVGVPVLFAPTADFDPATPGTAILGFRAGTSAEAETKQIARVLAAAGMAKPDAAAADAIAIGNELAKLQTPGEQKLDAKALAKQTASIDWKAYTKALGVTPTAKLVVHAPGLFKGLDALRKRFKPAQWAGYFTYELLAATATALPKAFADASEEEPRFDRCISVTFEALPDDLGQAYVAKYLSAQTRQVASGLIEAVITAFHDDAASLDWMAGQGRGRVLERLARLVRIVGFPDKWRSYDFEVKRDDLAGNLLRAKAFDVRRQLMQIGKPLEPAEARPDTLARVPRYQPVINVLEVPAGFLQPPVFAERRSIAANAGGISISVGNELASGLREGWTSDDKAKYDAKADCVAQQYATFEAAPKQFIDGKRTLDSNVGDLAGVKLAFRAYRSLRKGAAQPIVADGFTEDQQFFLGVAQANCSKARPAELQRILSSSTEAPPKFRVFGALRNLPEFAQAFSCAAGTPMHPAQTCSVW